jgi:hypothetical protein
MKHLLVLLLLLHGAGVMVQAGTLSLCFDTISTMDLTRATDNHDAQERT